MTVHVLRAGTFTTVQDVGRPAFQHAGVSESGAMDTMSLRIANLLVDNARDAAMFEATLDGPSLRFDDARDVAICGARIEATVDGRAVSTWRREHVKAGGILECGQVTRGCRVYIAVAGGIDVPTVLGSRSTDARAAIGGVQGRALRRGDAISLGAARVRRSRDESRAGEVQIAARIISPSARPSIGEVVRLIAGPALQALGPGSRQRFFDSPFRVTAQSDRMGYRLEGPPLSFANEMQPPSAPVAFGTVQLPPGGAPIILMADRQTTGGYPRLGEIASVDLPVVAQRRPGDTLQFAEISLEEAQRLYVARERDLAALTIALAYPP